MRRQRLRGHDVKDARRRWLIPAAIAAERASNEQDNLAKVGKGGSGRPRRTYITVRFVLDLIDRVSALADPSADHIGLRLEEEQPPQPIRRKCHKTPGESDG